MSGENQPKKPTETELESFVSQSIMAVLRGISEADRFTRLPDGGGLVVTDEYGPLLIHRVDVGLPDAIEIDVAVTAARKRGKEGGFSIQVVSVGANAGGSTQSEQTTASRVSMRIPLTWRDKK